MFWQLSERQMCKAHLVMIIFTFSFAYSIFLYGVLSWIHSWLITFSFQRFYRYLELKSRDPDTAVPPIDETLRQISEPDKELIAQNKSVIDAFRSRFELKENPKVITHYLVKLYLCRQFNVSYYTFSAIFSRLEGCGCLSFCVLA